MRVNCGVRGLMACGSDFNELKEKNIFNKILHLIKILNRENMKNFFFEISSYPIYLFHTFCQVFEINI